MSMFAKNFKKIKHTCGKMLKIKFFPQKFYYYLLLLYKSLISQHNLKPALTPLEKERTINVLSIYNYFKNCM
jgi:hypothetical protein